MVARGVARNVSFGDTYLHSALEPTRSARTSCRRHHPLLRVPSGRFELSPYQTCLLGLCNVVRFCGRQQKSIRITWFPFLCGRIGGAVRECAWFPHFDASHDVMGIGGSSLPRHIGMGLDAPTTLHGEAGRGGRSVDVARYPAKTI